MSAWTLLLPSWSMVLPRQTSVSASLGNTSEQSNFYRCSQKANRKWEDQTQPWFLTQLLRIPAMWVWMRHERDLSFSFSEMWHFLEKVACGCWWGPFLAATPPWGRGQCCCFPSWCESWKLPRTVEVLKALMGWVMYNVLRYLRVPTLILFLYKNSGS